MTFTASGEPQALELIVLDLEPALAAPLVKLLARYPEFHIHTSGNLENDSGSVEPDVVLVSPRRVDRLGEVRRRFPQAYILGRVPWDKDGYWNHPALNETLDELASFDTVVNTLLRIRQHHIARAASGPTEF